MVWKPVELVWSGMAADIAVMPGTIARSADRAPGFCMQSEVEFKIGFDTRRQGRNHQCAPAGAEHRINSLDRDLEFRNQQVAGSIPAGGSRVFRYLGLHSPEKPAQSGLLN
jgi:hypothetical protein